MVDILFRSRNLAEQYFILGVGNDTTGDDKVLVAFGPALGHLEIKVQQNTGQDELDLIGCKEATRTSVPPKAEVEVLLANRYKLVLFRALVPDRILILATTKARESIGVKGLLLEDQ